MKKINKKVKVIFLGVLIILALVVLIFIISNLSQKSEVENDDEEITLAEIQEQDEEIEENNIGSNLPDSFKANYISFQKYGSNIFKAEEYPKLESWVENGAIECTETPLESSLPLRISKKEINGQKYCIGAFSEGAAGSVFTEYAYTTVISDNVYLVQFIARYPNCSNYPDQERRECETERENFNLDNLVDLEVGQMKN